MEVSELDVRVKQKYMFTNFLFILTWLMFMQGCSSPEEPEPHYFKSFSHIKTNQYQWDYGQGGIYWVSDTAVVLDAVVNNNQGTPERGIYQVSTVDGSYVQLVSVGFNELYEYCYNGEILFIRNETGSFRIVAEPVRYKLKTELRKYFVDGHIYSAIRCKFVEKHALGGTIPLKNEDGVIQNVYDALDKDKVLIKLVNHGENESKVLATRSSNDGGISGMPYFNQSSDSYFGAYTQNGCSQIWWLHRQDWHLESESLCFANWSKSNSNIVHATKVGLFVENHKIEDAASYLISPKKEYRLNGAVRGSSLSTDGCTIAYGAGAINFGKKRFSQTLKIFNACQFIDVKEKNGSKGHKK